MKTEELALLGIAAWYFLKPGNVSTDTYSRPVDPRSSVEVNKRWTDPYKNIVQQPPESYVYDLYQYVKIPLQALPDLKFFKEDMGTYTNLYYTI